MKFFIQWGLRLSILSFAILHFFTAFIHVPFLLHILGISGLFILFFSCLHFTISKYKLPFILLLSGIGIIIYSEIGLIQGFFHGVIQMRDMVGLLVIIPLISWVLREEPYIEDIMAYFSRFIDTSRRFYFSLSAFTQVVAYFILFGSIPMMYQFAGIVLKNQKGEAWENFKGTATLRGFSLSTLWVISTPSLIYAIETLDASLWIVMIQGFSIAMLGTLLATLFSYFQEKNYQIKMTPILKQEMQSLINRTSKGNERRNKVIEFVLLFVTLFGSILFLHGYFKIKLMLIIPIVIIFWSIAFYLYKRRVNRLKTVAMTFFKKDMMNQAYQISIMLSVGVLIFGLNQTNFATNVVSGLYYIQEHIPFLNVLYLLPFILIFLGFFGLGPLTVMVLVAGILETLQIPYPPELIVLAITSGSAMSILLSPLVMPAIVLSASNGLSLLTNSMKFNYKFAIVIYIMVQTYIQTMVYFFY